MTLEQWVCSILHRIVWCCKHGEIWAVERCREEIVQRRLTCRFCTLLRVFQFGLFRMMMRLRYCYWWNCCRSTSGGDGWNDLCNRIVVDPFWMLKIWVIRMLTLEGDISSFDGNKHCCLADWWSNDKSTVYSSLHGVQSAMIRGDEAHNFLCSPQNSSMIAEQKATAISSPRHCNNNTAYS